MDKLKNPKLLIPLIIFFLPLLIYISIGNVLTFRSRMDSNHLKFINGKIPERMPDGDLQGSAFGQGNWIGKNFNREQSTGINNFQNGDRIDKVLPFKTYVAKGVEDKELDVIKIDYNIPENPFFIRWILDEIVEVEPGKYLGKVHLRILPFVPFTIMYFELSTPNLTY